MFDLIQVLKERKQPQGTMTSTGFEKIKNLCIHFEDLYILNQTSRRYNVCRPTN